MKIVVFGATGQTGQHIVRALLIAGHSVTAFARSPEKLREFTAKVTIAQGDGRDQTAVMAAMRGQDAVIMAVGPRSTKVDDMQEVFTDNVITAMRQSGVKRLIDLSAWGAGDSYATSNLMFKLIQKTVLKHVFADKNRAEKLILASDVEYTLVRPGHLGNGVAKAGVGASLDGAGLSRSINRQDVANFMVGQLADTAWLRQAPLIGYKS